MATPADFLVGDLIGEGKFGQVVLGRHKNSGKYVAVKVIDKLSLQRRPWLLDAVLSEQRILLELRGCNNVVKLWASFHDEQCLYLVMECATGGDLTHVIRQGMLHGTVTCREQAVRHFGLMILAAVEQIHSKGIIHADLKPDNILLSNRGVIQLADFGSAVIISPRSPHLVQRAWPQARGTTEYSCPEIIRGSEDLSVSADLWSFGCILFAMLSGESPFHAASDALVVERIQSFTNLRFRNADVLDLSTNLSLAYGPDWRSFILKFLNLDPLQRLGRADYTSHSLSDSGHALEYVSIRAHSIWCKIDVSQDGQFIPPEPHWWSKSRESSMRDGSLGWAAFVL